MYNLEPMFVQTENKDKRMGFFRLIVVGVCLSSAALYAADPATPPDDFKISKDGCSARLRRICHNGFKSFFMEDQMGFDFNTLISIL
jgi:hypothetical protein